MGTWANLISGVHGALRCCTFMRENNLVWLAAHFVTFKFISVVFLLFVFHLQMNENNCCQFKICVYIERIGKHFENTICKPQEKMRHLQCYIFSWWKEPIFWAILPFLLLHIFL